MYDRSYPPPEANSEETVRYEESAMYEEKIRRLEDSVSSLRLSRRILMSLLEQVQGGHKAELERLTKENRRLKRQLADHAQQIWQLNTARKHGGSQ